MTTAPGRLSPPLVWELYVTYRGELKRQYPYRNLLNGGEPITLLIIRGVYVNNSSNNILRFWHALDFQEPINTAKIEYHIDKMFQVTRIKVGITEKMVHFWWIENTITTNREERSRVIGGQGVNS